MLKYEGYISHIVERLEDKTYSIKEEFKEDYLRAGIKLKAYRLLTVLSDPASLKQLSGPNLYSVYDTIDDLVGYLVLFREYIG